MQVSDFDYPLPEALVAQHPAARRSASRLLRLHAGSGALEDLAFTDLPQLVGGADALVINDTRVMKARLPGRKASGGKVEVFVERLLDARRALALIRSSHAPAQGARLFVAEDVEVTVEGRQDDLYKLHFETDIAPLLERAGAVPLPPYIRHVPRTEDAERYQTVYAQVPGAVAAPTAGLHFDAAMLKKVEGTGAKVARLTLHVGAGTFQPVRADEVAAHRMHKEVYSIPEETMKAIAGKRVLAVGTTSLRALETAAATGKLQGETDLFVYPGFEFRVVRRLLTNFHLPKSTLLMLVCAFGGTEKVLHAYAHAVRNKYRFFSYGDAMLIER